MPRIFRSDRSVYFPFALGLLGLSLLAPFVLSGPLSWIPGLIYILYDTFLLLFVSAVVVGLNHKRRKTEAQSALEPVTIAVVIPARNERKRLPACLEAVLSQTEAADEIHLINDGSTDGFDFSSLSVNGAPKVQVWLKPHTGKANSLNQVWPAVKADVMITLDADTVLELDALAAMKEAFSNDPDLAAAGGVLVPTRGVGNWQSRLFEFYQHFEYIRAFLSRRAWMEKDSLLLVSGAFAAYRTSVIREIGGYDETSLVEDYELIHRLHRFRFEEGRRLKVAVLARARAQTEVPGGVRSFLKQRRRWFGGFIQTHFRYAQMIGNPVYGKVGTLMLPLKSLDTLQPLYGAVAFFSLIFLLASHRVVGAWLLTLIGIKLSIDLIFHFVSIRLYYQWAGKKISAQEWALAVVATLTEPFSFQLLRHLGAIMGWVTAFRSQNDWAFKKA